MRLRAAVGALAERNFRLLFASSTISGLGDGISLVALVFAVLQVSDSAIDLGLGLAEGFYLPASTGLIPATISPGRLQQANALLGLSRNATRIVGPAIGGAIVAAGSPGSALLIDAASFALGALLLVPLRVPRRDDVVETKSFFADM